MSPYFQWLQGSYPFVKYMTPETEPEHKKVR